MIAITPERKRSREMAEEAILSWQEVINALEKAKFHADPMGNPA